MAYSLGCKQGFRSVTFYTANLDLLKTYPPENAIKFKMP